MTSPRHPLARRLVVPAAALLLALALTAVYDDAPALMPPAPFSGALRAGAALHLSVVVGLGAGPPIVASVQPVVRTGTGTLAARRHALLAGTVRVTFTFASACDRAPPDRWPAARSHRRAGAHPAALDRALRACAPTRMLTVRVGDSSPWNAARVAAPTRRDEDGVGAVGIAQE